MVQINTKKYAEAPRQFPGSVKVTKLTVNGVDMSDYYEQIDIFESVYAATMSGRLTVVDTANHIKNVPIIGEEIVEIEFNDEVESISVKFRCYKITDRVNPQHGVIKYVMHLCSEEFYADSFLKVSKSYNLKKFESNVEDILRNPAYLGSDKPLIAGDTREPRCIVVPYWSPLYAVGWMGNRAQAMEANYKGGDFLFYETVNGFHWVAIDNLYDENANQTYGKVSYDPMRPTSDGRTRYDSRGPSDVMRMEGWNVVTTFDTVQNAKMGMYGNRTRVIDIVQRDYSDHDFNYLSEFYDYEHLEGVGGINAKPLCSFEHPAPQFPDAHMRVVVKHQGLFDNEPDGNSQIEEWLPPKISQRQQMENFKIRGQLPGHIGLTAGMVVEFFFPNAEKISINENPGIDPAYSGQYLITALRRMIKRDKFDIIVDMIKDSRGVDPQAAIGF